MDRHEQLIYQQLHTEIYTEYRAVVMIHIGIAGNERVVTERELG